MKSSDGVCTLSSSTFHVSALERACGGAQAPAAEEDDDAESHTLFVDRITDMVAYSQIRALFSQIGALGKVFVQRFRKTGRKFRFGFVHFRSKAHALRAIDRFNGFKVGGSYISVTEARFPPGFSERRQIGARSGFQKKVGGSSGGDWTEKLLSPAEECLFSELWRGWVVPVDFLFPEHCGDGAPAANTLSPPDSEGGGCRTPSN